MTAPGTHGVRLSIFTWAVYVFAVGIGLLLAPRRLLDLLDMDAPADSWARVAGVGLLVAAAYYLGAAIHRARWLYWYSVPVRILAAVGLSLLAIREEVWQLWLFAAAEIAGAGWTFVALRWRPQPPPLEPTASG